MRLVLTGGGTGGHIMPNIAVIKELKKIDSNIKLFYIGSKTGMEKKIMKDLELKYFAISCGKLRRYFSLENFLDFFRVIAGIFQSFFILGKIKPDVVFSKGGFVSLPVVVAAYLRRIPVVIHESDLTPGLANKIAIRFAKVACLSFEETKKYLPKFKGKTIITGSPIREEMLNGNALKASKFLNFKTKKPALLVVGGSTGAKQINDLVKEGLDELLQEYNIVHLTGQKKTSDTVHEGYKQFDFLDKEWPDIFAFADVIVSRAGANSLFEIALNKMRAVIIPMETGRGDQQINAKIFADELGYKILNGKFTVKDFVKSVRMAMKNEVIISQKFKNGSSAIAKELLSFSKK